MKLAAFIGVAALLALLFLSANSQRSIVDANVPGPTPAPLLTCADVNADGPVAGSDFFALLGKFGTTFPNANFSYVYDMNADHAVAGGDFFATLADFGQTCPLADTQIALATLWGSGGTVPSSCSANNPSPPLTENTGALSAIGYTGGGQDVPGQGVHYIKLPNWVTGFDPCRPEGLVYNNGRLVAQLYYISGDVVGWGPVEPPPEDNVDIDAFCNTTQYGGPCSWSNDNGSEGVDGWHIHFNLCTIHIGTPYASSTHTGSAAACQAIHDQEPGLGGTWTWAARVGWMGHLWNHDLSGNGRLSDCAPDPDGYFLWTDLLNGGTINGNGTKGVFGPYDCPQ